MCCFRVDNDRLYTLQALSGSDRSLWLRALDGKEPVRDSSSCFVCAWTSFSYLLSPKIAIDSGVYIPRNVFACTFITCMRFDHSIACL